MSYRVCHMTSVHAAEDVRIFQKECSSLAQAGYEVFLVERGESYDKNGVHIVGVGEISGKRLRRMSEGAKRVYDKALELDCDIYHIHDPELLPYASKLKKIGKKVIFDSHENTVGAILEKQYLPLATRKALSALFSKYVKTVCKKLDAIVDVTPSQTEVYQKINPNTWEIRNYPIISKDFRKPSFERKDMVFAGGIQSQWNHHLIIEALSDLPDCRYVLCGGSNQYCESLKTLPGWSQVEYKGTVPYSSVPEILSQCSVGLALLSPGRNTAWQMGTMGNTKIFEEMMAGLPVICTDFLLWKEFVERYDCGICIDPTDKTALISAVRFLMEHPEKAKKMGENGRKAIEQEFNWGLMKESLLRLYESVAGGK